MKEGKSKKKLGPSRVRTHDFLMLRSDHNSCALTAALTLYFAQSAFNVPRRSLAPFIFLGRKRTATAAAAATAAAVTGGDGES